MVGSAGFRHNMNQLQASEQQIFEINLFFSELAEKGQRLSYQKERNQFMNTVKENEIATCIRKAISTYLDNGRREAGGIIQYGHS